MKLPNGYGSITKLSGPRRNPYMVRITIGYDDFGRQIRKILGYFPKRSEALAALAEYEKCPTDLERRNITFSDVYERMCKEKYTNGKEPPNQYKAAYNRCQNLHSEIFCNLKTSDLQKIINECDKGYASKKAIRIVLNLMYKYALSNDIVIKNYAELTTLPSQTQSRLHKPLSPQELDTLRKTADNDVRVQLCLILCYTGLRPTELLKIKKENVFLQERYMLGGTKTAAGKNRIVPISEKIFPYIESLYYAKPQATFLVENDDGPLNYDKLRLRYWEPVMRTFGMNHLPHDGRHTCATLMDNAGINEVIRKKILGHAGKDVTEKVYTHKSINQLVEAINRI